VDVADAPTGQTEVFSLFGVNYDTVEHTLVAERRTGGVVDIEVGRITLGARSGASGPYEMGAFLKTACVLKAADETLTVRMLAAVTTLAPKVDVSMCKVTP